MSVESLACQSPRNLVISSPLVSPDLPKPSGDSSSKTVCAAVRSSGWGCLVIVSSFRSASRA